MNTSIESQGTLLRHIVKISVRGLFGHLNYNIPEKEYDSAYDDLLILYGDNGSGKTTLLRLVFCLLSAKDGRGHKTALATIPFSSFEIRFNDGASIGAFKESPSLVGAYKVQITQSSGQSASYDLKYSDDGSLIRQENPIEPLLQHLADLKVSLYFLPDDRKVQADFVDDMFEDTHLQARRPRQDEMRRNLSRNLLKSSDYVLTYSDPEPVESHHLEIRPVLRALVSALRRQTLLGSNAGQENASSIYLRVVDQLKSFVWPAEKEKSSSSEDLILRLETLNTNVTKFAGFGLVPPFPAEGFITAFRDASDHDKQTIQGVLDPYLEGLEARLDALREIYEIASTYVDTLNSFFSNKIINLDIHRGLTVTSRWGQLLDPDVLSSGERQLLLLLSNTILARKQSSIFIIDEPELSLNVMWQRQLVGALLKCSHGGGIQYILASHSLELITQYRERTVRLQSFGS
jgi:energy-coupling factor transporter ATP-binding protein EcfA2